MFNFLVNWIASVPSSAVPYALAALGLIVTGRAGVLSLGAEGFMLVGAMAGVGSYLVFDGYPFLALIVAMLAAGLVSILFAVLVVLLRVNQVIAGLVIVFFCEGLTSLVGSLADWNNKAISGMSKLVLAPLSDIPVLGQILFSQDLLVYLLVPIFYLVTRALTHSTVGLRLRAVGENPEAADAAGVNVTVYRFVAVLAGSALIGLAGAYMSVVSAKIWVNDMASGRGWIAVGLVIFAGWQPWRALLGALLFGCIEAVIPRIAAAGIHVPQYIVMMTPYVATLAVMVWTGATKRLGSDDPGALGEPFVREERR